MKKIHYKGQEISKKLYNFNKCLPNDFRLITETITSKKLDNIFNDIATNYPPWQAMEIFDSIKNLGFEESTKQGYTLGIDDLYDEYFEKYINTLNEKDGHHENIKKITGNSKILKKIFNKPYFRYIESGARGSMDQLLQLIVSRGYVADANNKIVNKLIRSSLITGLNEEEFFYSSYGTRKGLLDVANSTQKSGYITRQLVYSSVIMELDNKIEDCYTTDCLDIEVIIKNPDGSINDIKTDQFAKSLIWRYILVGKNDDKILITNDNYKAIIGKRIKIRTPLYCKSSKICKTCYGALEKILHSDQIGIIAAQALGERSTQLVLRTFHTSGVVSKQSGKSEQNEDIISGISIVGKLLHNPYKLNINTDKELILNLYDIFSQYGNINMVHFEVIVSAMMWYNDHLWRTFKNRNNYPYKLESIMQVPSKSSWLLGLAFSKLKSKLLDGLISNKHDPITALSDLFKY